MRSSRRRRLSQAPSSKLKPQMAQRASGSGSGALPTYTPIAALDLPPAAAYFTFGIHSPSEHSIKGWLPTTQVLRASLRPSPLGCLPSAHGPLALERGQDRHLRFLALQSLADHSVIQWF